MLQNDHSTKVGTWGIIHVLEGTLAYTINCPDIKQYEISKSVKGVISPCMLHSVEPKGRVLFYVEFYSKNPS